MVSWGERVKWPWSRLGQQMASIYKPSTQSSSSRQNRIFVKYPLRPLTMQQIVQLIVWKCQIVTLRSVVDRSIITRFSKVSDNYEANMKLIQARRCVWSICNNAACGDEWFKAQRTQEDIVCLSLSAKPVSMSFHRPEIWFLDLWHLITWALLISKFMNVEIKGRPARLICFISRELDFCPG